MVEIQRATERAAALTAQLLAFSRKQVVAPVVVDLNQLLLGEMRILERLIGEDVQVSFKPGSALRAVRVDPSGMEQVLINLAVNARDAMPQGGVLSIATSMVELDAAFCQNHLDARPGWHVLMRVQDTDLLLSDVILPNMNGRQIREARGTAAELARLVHIWLHGKHWPVRE